MVKEDSNMKKAIAAGFIGIAAAGAALGGLGVKAFDNGFTPEQVAQAEKIAFEKGASSVTPEDGVTQKDVESAFEAGVNSVVIPEPEVVETIVEVPVESEKLDIVLEHIYDNDGKVQYLTDDLDDDEVNLIADRVVFINDIKELAIAEVKAEGVDELDKEVVNGTTLDDSDIERFRVDDDQDEVMVDDVDFEDGDADVYVTTRFEQDDVDYEATFRVEIKDGEVDDIRVEEVKLKE